MTLAYLGFLTLGFCLGIVVMAVIVAGRER